MDPIIVIPARGGSKGIPRKNLAHVDGVSLVGRSVTHGLAFASAHGIASDAVIVDTDSDEIAAEGRRCGANVPFLRPAEFALDTTRTIDSILHLVTRLGEGGRPVSDIVLLQPTSPLRAVEDITAAWDVRQEGHESVITVADAGHPLELAIRVGPAREMQWIVSDRPKNLRRQDLSPMFFPNGAVYICSVAFLRRAGEFVKAGETRCVVMPRLRSLDIDTPDDLALADAVARTMRSP